MDQKVQGEIEGVEKHPGEVDPGCLETVDRKRRTLVRGIAAGSAALAYCTVVPSNWTKPLLEFGALPAHATTSGALAEIINELKEEIIGEDEADSSKDEQDNDSGYSNSETIKRTGDIMIDGIIRSKFVSSKLGPDYGKSILITFNSGEELYVPDTKQDVNTSSGEGYRPGGNYTYHKDVHKMEVYAAPGSKATSITIHYNG